MGKGKRVEGKSIKERLLTIWNSVLSFIRKHIKIVVPAGAGVFALALTLTLVFALGGNGEDPDVTPEPSPVMPETSPSPAPLPSPPPSPASVPDFVLNPLTGLPLTDESLLYNRPVAVMHNNYYVKNSRNHALPMFGLSHADIIYEVLAEGSTTRMLAFYQDISGIPQIGTVRSTRRYYLELSLAYDAIHIHAGGSPEGYSNIREWGVDAIDGTAGYAGSWFWRDTDRIQAGVSSEHTLFTSAEHILNGIENRSFRTRIDEGFSNGLVFSGQAAPEGDPAETIEAALVSSKKTMFTYNGGDGLYYVWQYGDPLVDGGNGEQIAVTNVLILHTSFKTLDSVGRQQVDLIKPDGLGYYAVNGRYTEITWARESHDAPFRYFNSDGEALEILPGKTYVCVIPNNQTPAFE